MATATISYSPEVKGWTSFHSFEPDWMISLNSSTYTWKNGELYKHDTNATRNNYYGVDYPSTITPIFNQSPDTTKLFRTIELDSNSPWQADITTDLSTGIIEPSYYEEKEGGWFSYIRRDPDTIDLKAMSTQGIGNVGSYAALVITFGFTISASFAIGDKAYISNGTSLDAIGTITAHTGTTITVGAAANVPAPGDFIVVVKDSTAESFGARGYYMQVLLTNNDTTYAELFSVSSEAQKSFP